MWVNATIARAYQHATNTTRTTGSFVELDGSRSNPPDQGFGRARGGLSTKVHQLVDGHGLSPVTRITPGQAGDSPMVLPLLAELRVASLVGRPRARPDRGRGDNAYSFRAIRQRLRSRGIELVIPEPQYQ